MKKIIFSSLIIIAAMSPIVFAASNNPTSAKQNINHYTDCRTATIDCSGRCESCSDEDCPRRRRPYQGNN